MTISPRRMTRPETPRTGSTFNFVNDKEKEARSDTANDQRDKKVANPSLARSSSLSWQKIVKALVLLAHLKLANHLAI
jgi:hypothetical protein